MTDDDDSGFNAFKTVFGEEIRHLLCKWHIHRSWNRRLHKDIPTDDDLRREVYQHLIVLLEERNSHTFEAMARGFVIKFQPQCPVFVEYFQDNYLNCPEKWAMCYRNFEHGKTDTNMFVEAYHNRLKTFYMQRKWNKRIDDLLNILLTIESDDYWRRKRDISYCLPEAIPASDRHKKSLGIDEAVVAQEDEVSWKVQSQSESGKVYVVQHKGDVCFEDYCFERCLEIACLGLCGHFYTCTCPDLSNMCKHIHKVHSIRMRSYQNRQSVEDSNDMGPATSEIDNDFQLFTQELKVDNDSSPTSERRLERIFNNIEKLSSHLQDENVLRYTLLNIDSTIEDLVCKCVAVA